MYENKIISIVIKNANDILAIESLKQQNFKGWECFLINNSVENINEHIATDSRFHLLKTNNINDAIQLANGNYIIIINADDVFIPSALDYIYHMIYLTDADIINFKSKQLDTSNGIKNSKPDFNYICQKHYILEHVFDDLSCFCIKNDVICKTQDFSSDHLIVFDALKNAKDMTITVQTYLLKKTQHQIVQESFEYIKIIDNFLNNKNEFSPDFWKKYFATIMPDLVIKTKQTKKTFIALCKKIPLKLIPLKYRLTLFIMRIINR